MKTGLRFPSVPAVRHRAVQAEACVLRALIETTTEAEGAMVRQVFPGNPQIRRIILDGPGFPMSALVGEPRQGDPRAVVVALHGAGMDARYFGGEAHPTLSLLGLGADLGYTVLAIDRPGYGLSAAYLPGGLDLAEQSAALRVALACFAQGHQVGVGFFLLAHSFGGTLALHAAADGLCGAELLGTDVSGVGHSFAVGRHLLTGLNGRDSWRRHWGPLSLYPPGTFRLVRPLVVPQPVREQREMATWPERFPGVAARVRVPVRFTFAEHEQWWRHDDDSVAALVESFSRTEITVDRQFRAGHNISLGWAARSYHLRALGFLEDCLTRVALSA